MAAIARPPRPRTAAIGWLLGLAIALWMAGLAWAQPTFPPLTGRVVDAANMLSPAVEERLAGELKALEDSSGRQMVVATIPDLQGYEIEDYGYQLGRAWGIGDKDRDDGVVFIVAPNERKVRIEVGYGLEPVLTDALSSLILQRQVIPAFQAGDMEGGVVAGAEAIIAQLGLPEAEARALAARAEPATEEGGPVPLVAIVVAIVIFVILSFLFGPFWWVPLVMSGGGRGGGGFRGGGGGFGGGGFSGGGGSFGGGGSSGSW